VLPSEGRAGSVIIPGGGANSGDKVVEAVASHEVRDCGGDFIPQVEWMNFIHYCDGQRKAIWYAMIEAGKATEIRRLATY
jgi:hypothetical protein